jgi:predicted small metal-binding protein
MMELSCRSLGIDCDYIAKGETLDELMKDGMEHAKDAHPEKYAEMMKMTKQEKHKMMAEMEAKVTRG